MSNHENYDSEFFKNLKKGSLNSAKEIVPFLLKNLKINSVIDIGCGCGTWLKIFEDMGVKDITGVDGTNSNESLVINQKNLIIHNLNDLIKSFKPIKKYDIALSLEVAEHLNKEAGDALVKSLTSCSDIVLFSASIPDQGGGTNHVNEQWPDYWEKRFRKEGFVAIDAIRLNFWGNENVEPWYYQNTILYVRKGKIKSNSFLKKELEKTKSPIPSLVSPIIFITLQKKFNVVRKIFPNFIKRSSIIKAIFKKRSGY